MVPVRREPKKYILILKSKDEAHGEIKCLSCFTLAILIVLIIAVNIIRKIYPKVYKKDIRSSSSNIR